MDIGCTVGSGKIGVRPAGRRGAIVEKPDCFASTIRSLITFSAKKFSLHLFRPLLELCKALLWKRREINYAAQF